MRGGGGSLSDMRGGRGCVCAVVLGCGDTVVMGGVVSSCGMCVHGVGLSYDGSVVGDMVLFSHFHLHSN